MTTREGDTRHIDGGEAARSPSRAYAFMYLATTALTLCVAAGAAKGYEVYQDLQHPQYEIDLDTLVGGTE